MHNRLKSTVFNTPVLTVLTFSFTVMVALARTNEMISL